MGFFAQKVALGVPPLSDAQ